jgi:hypothetical protein
MMSNLETVRDYIGDNTEPYNYSDERIEELLEKYVYPECTAAYIWQIKTTEILNKKVTAIKSVSIGAEGHTFESLTDSLNANREQLNYYLNLCSQLRNRRFFPT